MGNKAGKPQTQGEADNAPVRIDPRIETAFNSLNGGQPLTFQNFSDAFGEDMAESLWGYLTDSSGLCKKEGKLTQEQFGKYAARLMGTSHDIYVTICQPVHHLIKVCSEAAGAIAVEGDQHFIALLADQIKKHGSTEKDVIHWYKQNVPKLAEYVQARFLKKCLGYEMTLPDLSSDILSPIQMWYIQACLPAVYFPNSDKEGHHLKQWTPLYNSATQGVSVNRFEANVFDYRGPTVSIFQLTSGEVVVLATDQEWRHSRTRFGGPSTVYIQLSPTLFKVEAYPSIYCNFKIRSYALGLSFEEILKLDADLSNLRAIEVWGCAPASTKLEQQKLKDWQNKQAEKNKKVPLPGNWDDNPDKTIMEMAGFQFSTERRLMDEEERKGNRNV